MHGWLTVKSGGKSYLVSDWLLNLGGSVDVTQGVSVGTYYGNTGFSRGIDNGLGNRVNSHGLGVGGGLSHFTWEDSWEFVRRDWLYAGGGVQVGLDYSGGVSSCGGVLHGHWLFPFSGGVGVDCGGFRSSCSSGPSGCSWDSHAGGSDCMFSGSIRQLGGV